ncbi:MAG: hypothetical protein R3C39_05900 [Dehalococcoidia bacterium]
MTPDPVGEIRVRQATPEDLPAVRLQIAKVLLAAGYDPPSSRRDEDIDDPGYYEGAGRGLWVAHDSRGVIVGCAAIDRGDQGAAVLRRLAGIGLYALLSAAIQFARRQRYQRVETVIPPGMEEARTALEANGFEATATGSLLYRRELGTV